MVVRLNMLLEPRFGSFGWPAHHGLDTGGEHPPHSAAGDEKAGIQKERAQEGLHRIGEVRAPAAPPRALLTHPNAKQLPKLEPLPDLGERIGVHNRSASLCQRPLGALREALKEPLTHRELQNSVTQKLETLIVEVGRASSVK